VGAEGLRGAVAILLVSTGIGLVVGSANAETAAVAELEASETADSGVRDATSKAQRAEKIRERSELRFQRLEKTMANARAVLFDGIELSAEQSRGMDAIFEAGMRVGRRAGEPRAEHDTAQQQGDMERSDADLKESRPLRSQRKSPDERMEEMRVLLSEEQRPIFDLNRARLRAEKQQPQKEGRKRRPRVDAEVEAE
jgi:hypothetical protein